MSIRERFATRRVRPGKRKATGPVRRRRSLFLEVLEDRRLLAAVPTVTLDVPTAPFIGTSPLVIRATFDNTSAVPTDTGYGPFIDIVFPVNGADGVAGVGADGISPISGATYLGQPATTTPLTFPNDGGGTGCVDHPYAVNNAGTPLQVCGATGDILVVVQLPFGSFTPAQPSATIELQAALSSFADLGVPLEFTARGGFQFGSDSLNNPSVDPTILTPGSTSSNSSTWVESATTTPTVMTMTKTYVGPENETATGPNFPRQYVLTVSVAPGQTVTNLDIVDGFDNNIVVTGITAPPGSINVPAAPFGPANFPFPSQALVATIPTVTGTGGSDVVVTIDFYVPEFDADGDRIIPIDGEDDGVDSRTLNNARAQGDWTPLDPRDPPGVNNAVAEPDPVNPDHILDNKSIAIQKSVVVVGGGTPAPGKQLEYTLTFQISDYYTFGDLVITDTIGDGQNFLASPGVPVSTPTFAVSDRSGTTAGTFGITFPAVPADTLSYTANVDGTETMVFDVSKAMQAFGDDGILVGGLATAADDLGIPPANAGLQAPALGTVTFRVVIPDQYTTLPPSGSPPIAQGDSLTNAARIDGTVRDNAAPGTVIGSEDDDTSTGTGIPIGSVSKSIYAVNGVVPPPPGFVLAPGDRLTYSLGYTLPISSFVDFSLTDFLPLPVFDVLDPLGTGIPTAWSFNVEPAGPARTAPPAPGVVELGPNDTLYDSTLPFLPVAGYSSPPTLSTSGAANSLSFTYGDFNSPSNVTNQVQLLFTITASDRPFADGLFLTNLVQATEANSVLQATTDDAIIQIQMGQPELGITKGVVATDYPVPPAAFDPLPVGPAGVTFNPPGSASSFTGTVTSTGLAANPIDSNLQNIDAGNLVTFAIVVENTGSSRKGAFDVLVRDTLPAGFRIPTALESAAQLNLQVRDGTGAVIDCDNGTGTIIACTGGDLFGSGLELHDPGPTPPTADGTNDGALDPYNATSGRNILVLTYDLIADTSVQPRETMTNTATLLAFAGADDGDNRVAPTDQPFDEAEVTIAAPTVDKSFIATNQAFTADPDAAIGEIVTYQAVITVPEGTTSNAVLVDVLDSGLAFVDMVGITASPGVSTSVVGGFPAVASGVAVANVDGGVINDGRRITLNFGTVTNANTNDAVPETITVTYRAVVLNSSNNNRGDQRNNLADWRWQDDFGPQNVQDSASDVRIVEPTLAVIKDASPITGQAGDTITFTIEVRHTLFSNADAFNVVLTDLIPARMTYVGGSLSNTSGVVPTSLTESLGTITVIWDTFPDNSSSFLTFNATLDFTVTPGEVITNNAAATWTSLPGNATIAQSAYNTLSTERTGDPANPGGAANDYLATDSASVTIIYPQALEKTIVHTSESFTGGADVAIGEIVRYRLRATLIEGINPNYTFVDRLQNGLSFLDLSQVKVSFLSNTPIGAPPDMWGANVGGLPPTFVMPASRITVAGQQVTFNFGTLVDTDNDAGDEIVVLEFNALVRNTAATNNGNNRSNVFDLRVGGNLIDTSDPINVRIREPSITNLDKQVIGLPPVDAGDPVTYRVTYSNTGTTDAFDVRVVDTLNSTYLALALPPAIGLAGGAGLAHDNSVGNTLDVSVDRVPVGGSVTITYAATLTAAVEPSLVIPNTANLTYTSLPGPNGTPAGLENLTGSSTPGASGASDGERNGSGGVNDYSDTDSENVTVQSPAFAKTLTATNQVHTLGLEVAIGEIVTYEAVITVPEGTMPNAIVVDTPDAGLAIVAVDSITRSNPLALSTSVAGGFPQVLVNANASIPVSGSSVTLNFGTLTNTNTNNAVAETITVTYRAVVLNTLANSRGFSLDNAARLTWSQGTLTDTADPVTIVEPTLSITKQNGDPLVGDAGDVITFEILVQHTVDSDADAFDVQLIDLINTMVAGKMTYVPNSVAVIDAGGATLAPGSPSQAGGDLNITWSSFPLPATSTITFQVTLDITVNPNEILTNTADLNWTGLPGNVTVPQSSNPYSVERTGDPAGPGQPGANDYLASDSGIVLTPTIAASKEILDTSEPSTDTGEHNPAITDLTIGETVTFGIVVNFIDGTTDNVVITDQLPFAPGVLQYVSAGLAFVGADLTAGGGGPVTLPAPVLTDTNGDGVIDRVVLNFGSIVNAADVRPVPDADDQMVVGITARVLNLLPAPPAAPGTEANQDGMLLTNTATVTATGVGPLVDIAQVEVVEPDLNVTKDAAPPVVDGGDTVTFTMTVNHTAASTADAFDVAITDVLPAGLTYAGNVIPITGSGPAASVAGQTVTFFWTDIPLGAVPYTFTFDVTVDATITPGQTFLNVADLGWSTLPGPNPNERTYADSDSAEVVSSSTTLRDPAKSLVVTSESSTPDAPPPTLLAIGEIVRYRLQAELTEGRFPNLTFVDTLPLGMSFLDPSQVRVSFTSNTAMGLAPDLAGANNGAIPPTFVLPPGRISLSGQQVTFDLGTVTNNDNDASAELVTLEFNVLVDNTVNDNAGDVKSNAFQAFVDGVQYGDTQSVPVRLVEPLIADVAKQFVSMSGNQRTFQVSFSNTGTTTAFDTLVTDVIPAGASLNVGPISVTLGGGATGASTVGSTPGLLQVTIDEIPVGGTVLIQYSVTLTAASQTGLLNSVAVTTTSLPGLNGTTVNPTGSSTPGAPGAPNGERTGAGGVNDLADADNETLGSLGDLVWYDLNGNGVYNSGEPGLPNVDMTAVWAGPDGSLGTGDDVTLTTTTDASGIYFFNALPPGNYRVSVDTADIPAPLIPSFDLDGTLDSTTVVLLGTGQDRVDVDFGYTDPSTITGVKYSDTNGNGVRDPGEGPIANVRIYIDANDNRALDAGERTTVTDASGSYTLGNLLPGTYIVRELRPDYTIQTEPVGDGSYTVVIVVPGSIMADTDFGNHLVPPQIIDNGDPDFVIAGGWERVRCWIFFQSDAHYLCSPTPGTGSNYVQWNFSGLASGGRYQVSTTWAPASGLSPNALFTVTGGAVPADRRLDQRLPPSAYPGSFTADGFSWVDVDSSYAISGTTLSVRLSDDQTTGCLLADAVRIIQVTTPEIVVQDGGAELIDNVSTVNLGSTVPGTPLYRTFTVSNTGGDDLNLGVITLPDGFSLFAPLGQTVLAPDEATTFTVQLGAVLQGVYTGQVTLGNNDNDEAPFTFNIVGAVVSVSPAPTVPPPAPVPAPAPALPLIEVRDGASPLVSGLSGIDFGTTTVGSAANRVLTVTNRGAADLLLGTIVVPGPGFGASPLGDAVLSPGESATFTVSLIASTAGTYTGDLVMYDAASQAIFTVGLAGVVNAPPALLPPLILDNGVGVAGFTVSGFTSSSSTGFQGDTHYTRGDASGDAATWVFGGLPAGEYRVSVTYVRGSSRATNAPYTLAGVPGGSQTVLVNQQLAPNDRTDRGVGWKDLGVFAVSGGALSVRLTDAANGYVYADAVRVEQLSGGSSPAPPAPPPPPPPLSAPVVIDNGQSVAGFSASGLTYVTTSGYQGDIQYTRGDNTGDYAQWTFSGLPSGSYRISTTWVKGTSRASNAAYTLTGVNGGPANVLRNQQVAPDDLTWDGTVWEDLGTFQVTGGTLTVRLTDNANGYVYADAVRVEQLSPLEAVGVAEFGAGLPAFGAGLLTPPSASGLTAEAVELLTGAAVARWIAADAAAEQGGADVQVRVDDLPAGVLGLAAVHSRTIWVDVDADGRGWFIDATPGTDEEFQTELGQLVGVTSASRGRVDLLSVLAHELGHLLGYEDDYDDSDSTVMDYRLSAGLRRLPVPAAEIRSDAGAGLGNSLFDARWLPLDEARRVRAERREAAGTRTDAGLTALLAERPAVWAPVDEELARLTATPRKRVDDPEQWWDDVLSSVGDWLDPLDEILSFARQSR